MPLQTIGMAFAGFLVFTLVFGGGFGAIETGNVGVQSRWGTVFMKEVEPGIFVTPFSTIKEFSAKEISVQLNNLTPVAADKLFIKDLDLTVTYRVEPNRIAEVEVKYANRSEMLPNSEIWAPAYSLVRDLGRDAAYFEVASRESPAVHYDRENLAEGIRKRLQEDLDQHDPQTFRVTRVIIRNVVTDPSVEKAIVKAINNQRALEEAENRIRIAEMEAHLRVKEAEGIARANQALNSTLTPAYLQHEANKALMAFAEKGGVTTVILPANMSATPLINIGSPLPAAAEPASTGAGATNGAAGPGNGGNRPAGQPAPLPGRAGQNEEGPLAPALAPPPSGRTPPRTAPADAEFRQLLPLD